MKTFQITGLADTWVEADNEDDAIENSPAIPEGWDFDFDIEDLDEEEGKYRVTALVYCEVEAKNEEDAFEKMPEWNDDWGLDNIDVEEC